MTDAEAKKLLSDALTAYFDPWTGIGSSGRHAHGNEQAYGQHARAKTRALAAPGAAEQAIRAAGLNFEEIQRAVRTDERPQGAEEERTMKLSDDAGEGYTVPIESQEDVTCHCGAQGCTCGCLVWDKATCACNC